jgi:hypothetical protein
MKAYLYFTKRDKKNVKIAAVLNHPNDLYAKVDKITDLQLHPEWEKAIEELAQEYKMQWDLWIETADNFKDLQGRLIRRGFDKTPIRPTPLVTKLLNTNAIRAIGFERPKPMIKRQSIRDLTNQAQRTKHRGI